MGELLGGRAELDEGCCSSPAKGVPGAIGGKAAEHVREGGSGRDRAVGEVLAKKLDPGAEEWGCGAPADGAVSFGCGEAQAEGSQGRGGEADGLADPEEESERDEK